MCKQTLNEYLQQCCQEHGFISIVVADHTGMMLAHQGEIIDDAFVAHLPVWLAAGDRVSEMGGLGGAACCCIVPENRSSLMLAWSEERVNGEDVYLAVLTRSLPPRLSATLKKTAQSICALIDAATLLR
jgi:hypothetical protein